MTKMEPFHDEVTMNKPPHDPPSRAKKSASDHRGTASTPVHDADRQSVIAAGRNGGLKSAINRPAPADAAARRKAALHALRYAFEAEITDTDRPSTPAAGRPTRPSHDN